MALAGTLKDFSLADIFQLIGLQKKTGTLTLVNDSEEARILFMNGMVVGADTNSQKLENHLGHVLVKSNRITQEELERVLTIQSQTLQRLGQVLVQKGYIKPEDLRESLQTQTTQIIYRLFRWTDGEYHFHQERYVDYDQENFTPITSESILMEGVRMLDEWPMIEKVIPDFKVMVERTPRGKAIKLNVEDNFSLESNDGESFNSLLQGVISDGSNSDGEDTGDGTLNASQELVLKLIEGPSVVQDLIDRGGMNEFETCRALYDLMGMGLVKRLVDREPETSTKSMEEESKIPLWMPAALVGALALFSFLVMWNPLNRYFPLPSLIHRNDAQYLATTRYRLEKVAHAVDMYYIHRKRLPLNLAELTSQGLLESRDILDPEGREFLYELLANQNHYKIFAADRGDQRLSSLLIKEKVFVPEPSVLDF